MVVDSVPRISLVNRRLKVRRFWRSEPVKRRRATQAGFARALGESTTAVNNFENGERDDFPNGATARDYEAYLLGLEAEMEQESRNREGK